VPPSTLLHASATGHTVRIKEVCVSFALDTRVFMSRESFYRGCAEQPEGRYEPVDGEVLAMSPERFGHARTKQAIFMALLAAMAQTRFSPEHVSGRYGRQACRLFPYPIGRTLPDRSSHAAAGDPPCAWRWADH
jgi:hypothetical protein